MILPIIETFTKELPADSTLQNSRRQVFEAGFSYVNPKKTAAPKLIHVSEEMLSTLGISKADSRTSYFRDIFTGNEIYPNSKPYAMCYGGHQFGTWAGQLGDGRAINLFEIEHQSKH